MSVIDKDLSRNIENIVVLVVLGFIGIGCFFVLRPFISALLWSAILAFSTWPIYTRLTGLLKGRKSLAAAIMTLVLAAAFILPVVVLGTTLADNLTALVAFLRQVADEGLPALPTWVGRLPLIGPYVTGQWAEWTNDSSRLVSDIKPLILKSRDILVSSGITVGQGVLQLTLSIITCFFFYRDGRAAADKVLAILGRVAGERAGRLVSVGADTVKRVVNGILGTAAVQGALGALGFAIAGVPAPFLLGLLIFFMSMIPMGPPLVWIPAAIWLFTTSSKGWGIFMFLWGALVVSSVDNFIKPYLISRGGDLPLILVLLGVFGGVAAFGFIGLFLGPTLLAVGYSLISEWTVTKEEEGPQNSV